jgi:hypothetical protein
MSISVARSALAKNSIALEMRLSATIIDPQELTVAPEHPISNRCGVAIHFRSDFKARGVSSMCLHDSKVAAYEGSQPRCEGTGDLGGSTSQEAKQPQQSALTPT